MQHDRSQGVRSVSKDLGGARFALGQQGWVMAMRAELVSTSLLGRIRGWLVVSGADRDRSDVDAVHAATVEDGAQIVHPLQDESWGVRRFFVTYPNGRVINVVGHN